MEGKAKFISTPYSGYHHRGVPSEDGELTHTGPGTPCGEYLRRFWQPVALSSELKGFPVPIKIMHEELVTFRDRSGRVGVLELHCGHRGASLEFGQIRDRGISCCYHGWHYDVDGQILEMPGEPAETGFRERLCQGAYPALESYGFVWAYMGPPEKKPPFPRYDILETDELDHTDAASKVIWPCNWLQIRDNFMDPLHSVILHTISPDGTGFSAEHGVLGEIDFVETPIGMVYVNSRRMGDHIWVRMAETINPNMGSFGLNSENGSQEHGFNGPEATIWSVPIDDTHTINFRIRHFRHWQPRNVQAPRMSFAQEVRSYEEQQKLPGDYEAQISQRPIAIHALEHLVTSDKGIIILRKRLREGIAAVKVGKDPIGLFRREGEIIHTYCNDTVVKVPPAPTPEKDKQLRLKTALDLIQHYVARHPPRVSCDPGWLEIDRLAKH